MKKYICLHIYNQDIAKLIIDEKYKFIFESMPNLNKFLVTNNETSVFITFKNQNDSAISTDNRKISYNNFF